MIQLDFLAVLAEWPALLRGAGFTLGLSAAAAVLGVGLGVACGWARAWGPKPLAAAVGVYVELIRNTPFMTELQVFTRVVLPPALGRVWPAMTSQIVIVMLGSAVCGQISAQELSYAANLIHSRNFRAFEATIVATLIYLALSVGVRALLNWLGPRFIFGRLPNAGR
jgi:polar amino acid transport system permease protein